MLCQVISCSAIENYLTHENYFSRGHGDRSGGGQEGREEQVGGAGQGDREVLVRIPGQGEQHYHHE